MWIKTLCILITDFRLRLKFETLVSAKDEVTNVYSSLSVSNPRSWYSLLAILYSTRSFGYVVTPLTVMQNCQFNLILENVISTLIFKTVTAQKLLGLHNECYCNIMYLLYILIHSVFHDRKKTLVHCSSVINWFS